MSRRIDNCSRSLIPRVGIILLKLGEKKKYGNIRALWKEVVKMKIYNDVSFTISKIVNDSNFGSTAKDNKILANFYYRFPIVTFLLRVL